MYTLRITLRHPDSEADRHWYNARYFRSKDECFDYLERNYQIDEPDSLYNFEIITPQGEAHWL